MIKKKYSILSANLLTESMLATYLDTLLSNFIILNNEKKEKHRKWKNMEERDFYSAIWNIE
jgi:hypothetical protein